MRVILIIEQRVGGRRGGSRTQRLRPVRLMRVDRETWLETDWLLYGPTDPEVVEPPQIEPLRWAAE